MQYLNVSMLASSYIAHKFLIDLHTSRCQFLRVLLPVAISNASRNNFVRIEDRISGINVHVNNSLELLDSLILLSYNIRNILYTN